MIDRDKRNRKVHKLRVSKLTRISQQETQKKKCMIESDSSIKYSYLLFLEIPSQSDIIALKSLPGWAFTKASHISSTSNLSG